MAGQRVQRDILVVEPLDIVCFRTKSDDAPDGHTAKVENQISTRLDSVYSEKAVHAN